MSFSLDLNLMIIYFNFPLHWLYLDRIIAILFYSQTAEKGDKISQQLG
jgi:hypothetical protein